MKISNFKYQISTIAIALLLPCSCHRATLEEQCAEMVRKEWRRMPRNITTGVVLDSMKFHAPSRTLVYYYTMDDSLYTEEMIRLGKNQLRGQLLMEISNSVALKRLKDEGMSFRYIYMAGSTGKECLSLDFNNEDL